MSELEEKLNSVLNNPQLMQQILSMAQSLGHTQPQPSKEPPPEEPKPAFDPGLLQNLTKLATQNSVDGNQQALLNALCPYLSRERVGKLERAMRAARLAGAASAFLNAGGLQMLSGR